MTNSVDQDETAHYEPSHLDLHCLLSYLYKSTGLKGLYLDYRSFDQTQKPYYQCFAVYNLSCVLNVLVLRMFATWTIIQETPDNSNVFSIQYTFKYENYSKDRGACDSDIFL